ncbi:MAG: hypothetical protein E7439_05605 [Ruminococcaceae bacterium]|nr:hypothetical protein [Oscillospiraceae bacterium]
MKKLLALLLVLVTVLGLFAGCATEQTPKETEGSTPTEGSEPTEPEAPKYEVITIAQALELCGEPGNITEERYYIRGTIDAITNPTYGAMTISDATGSIYVYGTYSADGEVSYSAMTEKPYKGDEVLLHCILQNYNGNKEIKNARLIEFKRADVSTDIKDYTAMSIADARTAAEGAKVKVSGVVARITYANGKIPSGVMLVDGTNSIYVYDGDLAARVQIGNKITIGGTKTWWILGDEQTHAATFGYKGCCQLDSAVLVENDEKTDNAYDKSWIQESTVKEIMDTPLSTDITTTIFKVTALVKKAPGNGFTNYYINDLDGTTGSYVYTQCNGSDFDWIDAYDGKICTVYLTVLNAKSTNSGCVYRFLPIEIIDEGFDVTTVNGAEYAVKYHGAGQFLSSYTGNPALELLTSVDSELLKIKGAKLSYASSDSSVIAIKTSGGKTVMNCLKTGTATITVTGSYNGKTYSQKVTISVTINNQETKYPTVAEAINAQAGSTVTVKGIVGASLVNQTGFYLIDKTGVIAVLTTNDVLSTLKLGDEVVLECLRVHRQKEGSSNFGQSHLEITKVVANNYGNHSYSTESFITGKTITELSGLSTATDNSTNAYIVKGSIKLVEAQYYSNIYVTDGTTDWLLYTNSASQYNWLKAYAGQEITIEIAACDWNCKGYKGCVLAITLSDGTKIVNNLNFQ